MHAADKFAGEIGLPLRQFVTIYWYATDTGKLTAETFRQAMKRLVQWVRDQGAETAYVYVHENPMGQWGDVIPNTHFLIHRPQKISRAAFTAAIERSFKAHDGGALVQPRTIGGRPDHRLQYMGKAARQKDCRTKKGDRKRGGQGTINFKRSGASQNIGKTARARAGRLTSKKQ